MPMLRREYALCSLLLVPFVVAACGGEGGEGGEEAQAVAETEAVAVENPAVLTGTVAFEGTPPPNEPIDMSEEPTCAQKHSQQPTRHTVVVNPNGTLSNVFVYVKEGLTGSYPASGPSPTLDQQGCIYQPHVLGVQAGQPLTIRNSDAVLHNISANPSENRGFNISQPQEGMTSQRTFSTPEIMIPVECDVHGWMQAYIGVVDHPYFAVTGEDGSFRIENLPPGDYVLEAWHEKYGTQTMNVTVGPNETKDAGFRYNAGMAATAVVPLGRPIDLHVHHASHVRTAGRD